MLTMVIAEIKGREVFLRARGSRASRDLWLLRDRMLSTTEGHRAGPVQGRTGGSEKRMAGRVKESPPRGQPPEEACELGRISRSKEERMKGD